jgi:transcriptional regulator with XRE-family HTH domain
VKKKNATAVEPTRLEWVSRKLRELRLSRGLTLQAVANRMGVGHSRISDTESGRYDIKLTTLLRMLDALGTTPNDFFKDLPLLKEIGEGSREQNRKRE